MIKAVLFDIGNVLLFFSHDLMYQNMATVLGLDIDVFKKEIIDLQNHYESGKISTEEFYAYLEARAGKQHSKKEFIQAAQSIFTPNEAIFPVVESLKQENVKLILLSNIGEIHYQYIVEQYPIFQLFDSHILSYQIKACKPDQAIFEAAVKAADCSPQECFYIDDIPLFIEKARLLGIDAETYTEVSLLRSHLQKRNLL